MKILHAPYNIGGMAGFLADEQRRLGYYARSYTYDDLAYDRFGYKTDYHLKRKLDPWEILNRAQRYVRRFDVFQLYFGSGLLPDRFEDIHEMARLGKRIFFYFCGCDIRDEKYTTLHYPVSVCRHCYPKTCFPYQKQARELAANYGKTNFVSTPDLMEFVERPVLLPQPLDFTTIEAIGPKIYTPREGTFRVAHAPTNRKLKGSDFIISAVENLRRRGLDIELAVIEGTCHSDALRAYSQADIAVDQLLCGSYGMVSAELMALGVPTIAYLRDDLIGLYSETPPVINAGLDNLEDVLVYYYENRERLIPISEAGIRYAADVHHPIHVAKTCLEYYTA